MCHLKMNIQKVNVDIANPSMNSRSCRYISQYSFDGKVNVLIVLGICSKWAEQIELTIAKVAIQDK